MIIDNIIHETSYEENCIIAALLEGGISLPNSIQIARLQVRECGTVPLKPVDICTSGCVDMSIYEEIRASDILYAYFGADDDEVVHSTSCPRCGEVIEGNYAQIGQIILYHEVAHLHEARVAEMMKYGEEEDESKE